MYFGQTFSRVVKIYFVHGILDIYRAVYNAVGIPAFIDTKEYPLLLFTQSSHIAEGTAKLVDVDYLDVSFVDRLRHWCDFGQIFILNI